MGQILANQMSQKASGCPAIFRWEAFSENLKSAKNLDFWSFFEKKIRQIISIFFVFREN